MTLLDEAYRADEEFLLLEQDDPKTNTHSG
jgi:hypothetical protein